MSTRAMAQQLNMTIEQLHRNIRVLERGRGLG